MTDTARPKHTIRYTLIVTQEMDEKIDQLLKKQDRSVSKSDILRSAIRAYLDDQEDLIGSRRHFSKSLQTRLDSLEATMLFYQTVIIYLLSANFGVLRQATTGDSKIQAVTLIRTAIATALKEGQLLNGQISEVRKQLES